MLIADLGVSMVSIPQGLVLPEGIGFGTFPGNYRDSFTHAKKLAAGFSSNNEKDYSKQARAQDNCYWYNYGQLAYNKQIWIPAAGSVPTKVFSVLASTDNSAQPMSFGQMVALYGDYRRTTYCDDSSNCYLTNADTTHIKFSGNVMGKATYCPGPVTTAQYLGAIGSGLVPPFGSLGNTESNTAADDDYAEAGWWGDEMLRIANVNDWHFSNAAIAWYVGMHRLALVYVNKAIEDPKYWNRALHYEANALHSLTDLFAFGHVVTNRDSTSYGIMKSRKLEATPAYRWMENVLAMGAGRRDGDGRIGLSGSFPKISDASPVRNDFLASYRGTWAGRSKGEKSYHDHFNKQGATVRNLNGSKFTIHGDGMLHSMSEDAKQQIASAVQTSVQSLLDAYTLLKSGKSIDDIAAIGSSYFSALKWVPVYIERDVDNYFLGMVTRYADAVNEISGAGHSTARWADCQIPYLSGKDSTWPNKRKTPCTSF